MTASQKLLYAFIKDKLNKRILEINETIPSDSLGLIVGSPYHLSDKLRLTSINEYFYDKGSYNFIFSIKIYDKELYLIKMKMENTYIIFSFYDIINDIINDSTLIEFSINEIETIINLNLNHIALNDNKY